MRRKKTTVIIVMCVAMLFMAVGYALLSTRLNINGSTAVTSSWRVEFTAIRTANYKGGAYNNGNPTITSTTASFKVNLVQPGDEITYEIDITNFGDIIAEVKGATYSIDGSEAIYVDIDGVRKGTQIGSCEGLSTCPKATMIIKVGYDPLVEKDPTLKTKTIDITLDIGQYVSSNPTADAELVPELVQQNDTLVQQILRNNNAQSDVTIDFTKPSSYASSYTANIPDTSSSTGVVSLSFSTSTNYYWGSTYTFNSSTGMYTLKSATTSKWTGTWNFTLQTYPYTCKTTSTTCSTLYRIYSVDSTTTGTAHAFTSTANYTTNGQGLYYTSTGTEAGNTTYYFRGNVTNNYVSFANKLWRIVRINEDGSIRLVTEESVGTRAFNNTDSNAYVGYMHGVPYTTNYKDTHNNANDSIIKDYIDSWYEENLITYSKYLADTGFCNDRSIAPAAGIWNTYDQALGYGTNNDTYYGTYNRLVNTKQPQFACLQPNDLFTLKVSNKGNKALDYPIGLLTADEVIYAGGSIGYSNENMYLTNGTWYWTMSPYGLTNGTHTFEWRVNEDGMVNGYFTEESGGVRPIINLKADVIATLNGSGTPGSTSNPYVVVTN